MYHYTGVQYHYTREINMYHYTSVMIYHHRASVSKKHTYLCVTNTALYYDNLVNQCAAINLHQTVRYRICMPTARAATVSVATYA